MTGINVEEEDYSEIVWSDLEYVIGELDEVSPWDWLSLGEVLTKALNTTHLSPLYPITYTYEYPTSTQLFITLTTPYRKVVFEVTHKDSIFLDASKANYVHLAKKNWVMGIHSVTVCDKDSTVRIEKKKKKPALAATLFVAGVLGMLGLLPFTGGEETEGVLVALVVTIIYAGCYWYRFQEEKLNESYKYRSK